MADRRDVEVGESDELKSWVMGRDRVCGVRGGLAARSIPSESCFGAHSPSGHRLGALGAPVGRRLQGGTASTGSCSRQCCGVSARQVVQQERWFHQDRLNGALSVHAQRARSAMRRLFLALAFRDSPSLPHPTHCRKGRAEQDSLLCSLLSRIRVTHPTFPAIWLMMVHTSSSYRPTQSFPVYRCRLVLSPLLSRLMDDGHTGVSLPLRCAEANCRQIHQTCLNGHSWSETQIGLAWSSLDCGWERHSHDTHGLLGAYSRGCTFRASPTRPHQGHSRRRKSYTVGKLLI